MNRTALFGFSGKQALTVNPKFPALVFPFCPGTADSLNTDLVGSSNAQQFASRRQELVPTPLMSHHPLPADDLADACHGLVDGPRPRIHDEAPHLQADLISGKNSSGMGVKIVEQRPFARLKRHAMIWVHVWRNVVMENSLYGAGKRCRRQMQNRSEQVRSVVGLGEPSRDSACAMGLAHYSHARRRNWRRFFPVVTELNACENF